MGNVWHKTRDMNLIKACLSVCQERRLKIMRQPIRNVDQGTRKTNGLIHVCTKI